MDSKNRLAFEKGGLQVSVTIVYSVESVCFYMAMGFYSDDICSLNWFAALLCEVAWAVAHFLRRAFVKTLLTGIFQNETFNVSYTIFFFFLSPRWNISKKNWNHLAQ